MLTQTLLAAFAALVPLVASSAVPFDFHLARRTQYIDDLVSEDAILDAFIEANHPSAVPNRTWEDDNGETYQTLWTFDEADWQEMRASMLEKAGVVESDLVTHSTALTTRQDDPPAFFCKNINTNPTAYTASLSTAAAGVCQGFVYTAQFLGRRQVVQRNLPSINRRPLKATITFVGKQLEWLVASGCATAMSIGINQSCNRIEDGWRDKRPATSGFYTEPNNDLEASVTLTFDA